MNKRRVSKALGVLMKICYVGIAVCIIRSFKIASEVKKNG